jgi:hypothetical protein
MEQVVAVGEWLVLYGPDVVAAVVAMLSGIMGIAMLVPGDEPEATLKKVADWLAQFSRK